MWGGGRALERGDFSGVGRCVNGGETVERGGRIQRVVRDDAKGNGDDCRIYREIKAAAIAHTLAQITTCIYTDEPLTN